MKNIKQIVKTNYGQIASQNTSCCAGGSCCGGTTDYDFANISKLLGYTDKELTEVPDNSNLGLGCGNPLAISSLKEGETVVDLGSGAGFDSFLASREVGKNGKVIGVDMTEEMINKAQNNAKQGDFTNVEFRLGDIENLPIDDNSVDAIISNCVINLAPDKGKVFKEAYRVLKKGGRMFISDVVLAKELPPELKNDPQWLTGCVSGAILKQNYFQLLEKTGFTNVNITKELPMFEQNYALSVTFSAYK